MSEQTQKKKVIILFGGRADEHSISCISAGSVLRAIDRDRFDPIPVAITKEGQWILPDDDPCKWNLASGVMPELHIMATSRPISVDLDKGADGFYVLDSLTSEHRESLGHIDAIFPVLHGEYGEDGALQGFLETLNIPYVGCGVLASAVCMDKHFTKVVLRDAGIPVAPGLTFDARRFDQESHFKANKDEILTAVRNAHLEYPLFVKPAWGGSSFGVSRVDDEAHLISALWEAYPHSWRILVEQGIDGREIECAVLSLNPAEDPQTSWPGEIVIDAHEHDSDAFYDFDSKYTDASASHVEVPAQLPTDMLQKVRDTASRAFLAVNGRGLMRVDTFVQHDGTVMVNEINTMPGFTSISMYPKAWEVSGIGYQDVITKLIESICR